MSADGGYEDLDRELMSPHPATPYRGLPAVWSSTNCHPECGPIVATVRPRSTRMRTRTGGAGMRMATECEGGRRGGATSPFSPTPKKKGGET